MFPYKVGMQVFSIKAASERFNGLTGIIKEIRKDHRTPENTILCIYIKKKDRTFNWYQWRVRPLRLENYGEEDD